MGWRPQAARWAGSQERGRGCGDTTLPSRLPKRRCTTPPHPLDPPGGSARTPYTARARWLLGRGVARWPLYHLCVDPFVRRVGGALERGEGESAPPSHPAPRPHRPPRRGWGKRRRRSRLKTGRAKGDGTPHCCPRPPPSPSAYEDCHEARPLHQSYFVVPGSQWTAATLPRTWWRWGRRWRGGRRDVE